MTKREVAKELRSNLTAAIKSLPADVEYRSVSFHQDATTQSERDHESPYNRGGALHVIELVAEEARSE